MIRFVQTLELYCTFLSPEIFIEGSDHAAFQL